MVGIEKGDSNCTAGSQLNLGLRLDWKRLEQLAEMFVRLLTDFGNTSSEVHAVGISLETKQDLPSYCRAVDEGALE